MNADRQRVLVFGDRHIADTIERRINEQLSERYEYVGYYSGDGVYRLAGDLQDRPLTSSATIAQKLIQVVNETRADEVYLTSPLPYHAVTELILNRRGPRPFDCRALPEVYEQLVRRRRVKPSGSVLPSISLAASNLPRSYRILKRAMDILLSVVMLVLCLPLFLLVAILLKMSSRGPVLYHQIRAGENGYPFPLYKFRSMVANAEALLPQIVDIERLPEPVFKLKDDARVTPVGRILRRTSIDELPQIINVLKGEMSWVGPRPEDINIVRTYDAYFRERLKARPGITGLQQIRCRGVPSMKERMICDLDYIENRSLWLDVKILLQSVWVVLSMKGAW